MTTRGQLHWLQEEVYEDCVEYFPSLLKTPGLDKTSPRRRAYSTNQIIDYNPAKKVFTPSDPSSVVAKNPLRRAKVQELVGQMSPEHEAQWKKDFQV